MSSSSALPARSRRWWPYQGVMGLFWVAPATALFVGYLALPSHVTTNHCGAALFGCTVTPKDATVLLAMYVYPMLVIAGVLIMGIIAIGQASHRAWGRHDITGRRAVVALPVRLSPKCLLVVAPPVIPASGVPRSHLLQT